MFTLGLTILLIGIAYGASNEIVISTPDYFVLHHISSYGIYPTNSFITFNVKACNDATIGLLTEDVQLFYEIVIGGHSNARQYIRRTGNAMAHETDVRDFPDLLDCDNFKTFWVSWQAGHIKVGIGSLAEDQTVLANWTDPSPLLVDDVGVGTRYGSTGTWIFQKATLVTSTTSTTDTSMITMSKFDHFCAITGLFLIGNIMQKTTDTYSVECAMLCSADHTCIGYNYKRLSWECEFLGTDEREVYNVEWNFFRKCIQVN